MIVHGYTKDGLISASIDDVEMIVPDVTNNRHRQMIAAWESEGNKIPAYRAVVTKADVDAERDRRIVAGTSFTVTGAGDIPVTGRPEDQVTLLALKDTARDLKAVGVTDAIIPYRDGANTDHLLTADQVISLTDQGKAYVTAVYQASWTLKAMDPIPADYADDSHWPATS